MKGPTDPPLDDLDLEILSRLAGLFDEMDPPPTHLVEDAVFTVSMAYLDAEIATLQAPVDLALRGLAPSTPESITFTSSAVQLMVSPSMDEGETMRIDGWVTGGGIEVELVHASLRIPMVSDANGRLLWRGVPRGSVRFLIRPMSPNQRPVLTPVIEF